MRPTFGINDITYFTVYDGNGNIVMEENQKDFGIKDVSIHTQKPKPPLGVMPRDLYELLRIQELCRALYERSTFEEVDYDLMTKWSDELSDRLYGLKENQSNKKIKDEDDSWDFL